MPAASVAESVFWNNVDKDENHPSGCWSWRGKMMSAGYGYVSWFDGRTSPLAHRMAFLLFRGDIPIGMDVCHHCDNRRCVNPSHLWIGTRSQNMQDCANKGRCRSQAKPETLLRGKSHPLSKLTEDGVRQMRFLHSNGTPLRKLARDFGVARSTAMAAVVGKTWSHVVGPDDN